DVAANTDAATATIARAAEAGADLVVLPEMSMYFDPRHQDGPGPHGQPLDGPFARTMADAARSARIAVLVGMTESAEPDSDGRDYNTLLAVDADGEQLGSYRKVHLYDAFGYRESDDYLPGPIAD